MPQPGDRQTVLVVDDDPGVRAAVSLYLKFQGFEIVEACNGEEALTHLRAGCGAGAIVLDLRMPVMDGWSFRRAQREDPAIADIPVIVLSGADVDKVSSLEAAVTFEKPVKMSQLTAAVQQLFVRQ